MKEGVSAMARLFLFIPFPVETWRAASLKCMSAFRNINHSFIFDIYYQSMHMCVTI